MKNIAGIVKGNSHTASVSPHLLAPFYPPVEPSPPELCMNPLKTLMSPHLCLTWSLAPTCPSTYKQTAFSSPATPLQLGPTHQHIKHRLCICVCECVCVFPVCTLGLCEHTDFGHRLSQGEVLGSLSLHC